MRAKTKHRGFRRCFPSKRTVRFWRLACCLGAILAVSCASLAPEKCELHSAPLTRVRGYIRDPSQYRVFPFDEWYQVTNELPHYDKMLLYSPHATKEGDYRFLATRWICPVCTEIGGKRLAELYAKPKPR